MVGRTYADASEASPRDSDALLVNGAERGYFDITLIGRAREKFGKPSS